MLLGRIGDFSNGTKPEKELKAENKYEMKYGTDLAISCRINSRQKE